MAFGLHARARPIAVAVSLITLLAALVPTAGAAHVAPPRIIGGGPIPVLAAPKALPSRPLAPAMLREPHADLHLHPSVAGTFGWQNLTNGLGIADQTYGTPVYDGLPYQTSVEYPASPPAVADNAMAQDPYDGDGPGFDLSFGGLLANGNLSNQTWLYLNDFPGYWVNHWVNITNDSDAPPALLGASIDFDARIPGFVMFGGYAADGNFSDQTWIFFTDNGTWVNYTSTACFFYCPSGRVYASMVFAPDAADDTTVLFGGCTNFYCSSLVNDTWELVDFFGEFVWVPDTSTSYAPPPLYGAMMTNADNTAGNGTWLFGGCGVLGCGYNQTWYFYGGQWYNESYLFDGTPTPAGRAFGSLFYDPLVGAMLLVGGFNATIYGFNDTWALFCYSFCEWYNATDYFGGLPFSSFGMPANDSAFQTISYGGFNSSGWTTSGSYGLTYGINTSIQQSPPDPEVNQTDWFNATETGGPFGDSLASLWIIAGGGAEWASYYNSSFTFPTAGTYTAWGYFVDSQDVYNNTTWTFPVGAPTLSVHASAAATDVGVSVDFSSTTGGESTSPYYYNWSFGDGATGTGASAAHAYSAPGHYTATLNFTDAYTSTIATAAVTVNPTPTVTDAVVTAAPSAGVPVSFNSTVTGGTPAYTYAWSFGDGGTATSAGTANHSYASAGTYVVRLNVTDAAGVTVSAKTLNVTVATVTPLSATASANVSKAVVNVPILFTVTPTGGVTPYTYHWAFGDGATSSLGIVSHAYTTAGTYTATVWVNDSDAHSVKQTVSVTISAAKSGGGSTTSGNSGNVAGIPWWAWVVLAVVVIGAIAGILMARRRKGPETPPGGGPPAPWAEGPGTPPTGAGGPPPGATGGPPAPPAS